MGEKGISVSDSISGCSLAAEYTKIWSHSQAPYFDERKIYEKRVISLTIFK